MQVGDHIVEINGINTKHMTHADAINIIHSGGSCVRLLIRRSTKISHLSLEETCSYHDPYNFETQ